MDIHAAAQHLRRVADMLDNNSADVLAVTLRQPLDDRPFIRDEYGVVIGRGAPPPALMELTVKWRQHETA